MVHMHYIQYDLECLLKQVYTSNANELKDQSLNVEWNSFILYRRNIAHKIDLHIFRSFGT